MSVTVLDTITQYLNDQSVMYDLLEHEQFQNTVDAANLAEAGLDQGAKSMLFSAMGEYVLAVLPASQRVSYKKLRGAIGKSSIRLATPDEIHEVMTCEPGTCHPFGNLLGITTVYDPALSDHEKMFLSVGNRTNTIAVATSDYVRIVNPVITDLAK